MSSLWNEVRNNIFDCNMYLHGYTWMDQMESDPNIHGYCDNSN